MRFIETVAYALAASSLGFGGKLGVKGARAAEVVEHPEFTPFPAIDFEAVFWEQFDGTPEELAQRWQASEAKNAEADEFSYVGKWAFEAPSVIEGFKGDKGLVVKSPAARHAISAKLNEPLDNTDNTLVVQYEVKLQKGLECGGAYLKLLSEGAELHAEEFSGETPYQIMFGPDKCGSTNKVHFIVRRKSPATGEYEEQHLGAPPMARLNKLSNLYTLIIHQNQDFEIRINGDTVRAGNLLDEGAFKPGFNPPKTVEDPEDVKPEDWVDEQYIPDPEQAEKPEDWDEDAPFQIPDPEAEKPDDWLDDEEPFIADPEAEIPDGWDEEEDGEWLAPEVPNPACAAVEGCGVWEAPLVRNPAYKGKWSQPMVENPEYKGEWTPRQIPNPNYVEDSTPSNLEPIGAIGFELWTMQNDILFDNIYLGHSVEAAEYVGNNTFSPKLYIEVSEDKNNAPEPIQVDKSYESAVEYFHEDPIGYLKEVARVFILNLYNDPIQAIKDQPVFVLAMLSGLFFAAIILAAVMAIIALLISNVLFGSNVKPDFQKDYKEKTAADKKLIDSLAAEKAAVAEGKSEDKAESTATSSSTTAVKRKT